VGVAGLNLRNRSLTISAADSADGDFHTICPAADQEPVRDRASQNQDR
jgi:hypothetical protein